MPIYLKHLEMWKVIWPIPLAALLITLVLLMFGKPGTERRGWFWALLAFSMLGLVTGILAGFSRQPVVGAILPPVLSLVGGLAIYLVGKNTDARIIVSLCVITLSFNLLIGAAWGGILRETWDEYKNSAHYLKKQALIEIQVQEFRKELGLSEKR